MANIESTIDEQEVHKFARHAGHWWDTEGPLRTLHDINQIRLDFIRQQINLANIDVLDVGCGGGILCEAMAKAGAKVSGIDAEAEAVHVAAEHASHGQLNIEYTCTPIEKFNGKTFDAVTCMEMLEHVNHPELVLEHCRRVLKPGGLLFLSTLNRTPKAYATAIVGAEYLLNFLPKQTHDYEKFIKPSELLTITRSLGFSLLEMSGLKYNPFSRECFLSEDVSVNYLLALQG